jgi:hypothetical protein
MTVLVKHSKVSTIPDDTDTSLVRPSDWNADHTLTGTIDVTNGGTGASTLTGYVKGNGTSAMTAVATVPSTDITGLGTMSTQNANAIAITGGTINGTTIGATTPAAITATTITGQTARLNGTGTNLLLQSSVLTNAAWTQTNVTLTGSQTDPFGGTTASLFNSGTAASTQHYLAQNYTTLPTNTYTFSVYAKVGTTNFIGIYSTSVNQGAFFNISTGVFTGNIVGAPSSTSITNAGNGWYRVSITIVNASSAAFWLMMSEDGTSFTFTGTSKTVLVAAPQLELGSTANTYIPTTTTAVYGTPTLSFSGVSTLGLESNGALYLQPAGTGAIQAQATTSSTVGGNARGANAVDWQTSRGAAGQVASGTGAIIGGGNNNTASAVYATVLGGQQNTANGTISTVGGYSNTASGYFSGVFSGSTNTAAGYLNFVGGGQSNSGTSGSTVTTQSATMNATTAVTLSGSNANIKVGQLVTGTFLGFPNYVAAISGTSLTLATVASGSGTATLSFFTPHGVVVGGGNNQATGSYSFIGGGGDAGTAANRNVASGDWSFVGGGRANTASGIGAVIVGGGMFNASAIGPNTATGNSSFVGAGYNNNATNTGAGVLAGNNNTASGSFSSICGGSLSVANATNSTVVSGSYATTRAISGNTVFAASNNPIASVNGVQQCALLVLGVQTTDATATALRSDANAASGTNQVILPNNSAYFFTGEVVSGVTGGGNTKGWTIEGVIKRGANAASTALVGTPTVVSTYADVGAATWAIAVTADTTNGGIRVTFTGQAATTIRTVCQIRTTEMTY